MNGYNLSVLVCVCALTCKTGTKKKKYLELHSEKNTLPMPINGLYPRWAPSGVEKIIYFPIQPSLCPSMRVLKSPNYNHGFIMAEFFIHIDPYGWHRIVEFFYYLSSRVHQ